MPRFTHQSIHGRSAPSILDVLSSNLSSYPQKRQYDAHNPPEAFLRTKCLALLALFSWRQSSTPSKLPSSSPQPPKPKSYHLRLLDALTRLPLITSNRS